MKKKCITFLFILALGFCIKPSQSFAQLKSIPAGSYIIDMGIVPQTIGNGLKPYGMVYDMVRFQSVPVDWVINPNKVKDGTDFIYNGYEFKGGPFIISSAYRNPAIDAIITSWEAQGVIGVTTTSDINVPIYKTLNLFSCMDFRSWQRDLLFYHTLQMLVFLQMHTNLIHPRH